MWEWKYWDVAIAIVGFLVQCGLAYMGLTITHWKHKARFCALVLIGLAFTVFAVKRGINSADKVQQQLNQIQRNTEHPAIITVNPPQVVVKPPAAPKAELQFSFLPLGSNNLLIDAPLVSGAVTIEWTAKNVGSAQADNGQVWIQICDGCKFAEEPAGTTVPQGDDPLVRRKRFDTLHMGSYFEASTLRIIPPRGLSAFNVVFKYACERCPPIDNEKTQKLKINITGDQR